MSEKDPILELTTGTGDRNRRGLTLGDLGKARRLLAEGKLSPEQIEERYPGWEKARAEIDQSVAGSVKAMQGPGIAAAFEHLDVSRRLMGDTMQKAFTSGALGKALEAMRPVHLELPPLRDPDAATREVADEVRDLAGLVATMADTALVSGQVATASLDQTKALLTAVQSLEETTRMGIAAGEARDVAAAKREGALLWLTWAIVGLTAVLAVAEAPHAWERLEPVRAAIGDWLGGPASRFRFP